LKRSKRRITMEEIIKKERKTMKKRESSGRRRS
jgi:hypothetical protein